MMEAEPKNEISQSVHHFLISLGISCPLFDSSVFDLSYVDMSEPAIFESRAKAPPTGDSLDVFAPFIKFKFGASKNRALIPLTVAQSKLPMENISTKQSVLTLCEKELEKN